MYVNSAHELWEEITKRFSERNGPFEYQIQREINDAKQGNMSVALYFTKLKKL